MLNQGFECSCCGCWVSCEDNSQAANSERLCDACFEDEFGGDFVASEGNDMGFSSSEE